MITAFLSDQAAREQKPLEVGNRTALRENRKNRPKIDKNNLYSKVDIP